MPHIHIALVGGQTAPVLSVIKALKPDGVVLIYSPETEKEMQAIEEVLDAKFNLTTCESIKFDATDCHNIIEGFESIWGRYENATLSVNVSSGTKAWSFYAQTVLGNVPDITFYYIDQKNILWNLTSQTSTHVDPYMPNWWEDGYAQSVNYDDFTPEDLEAVGQIERLRHFSPDSFRDMTNTDYDNEPDPSADFEIQGYDDDVLRWDATDGSFFTDLKKGEEEIAETLKSPNIFYLLFNFSWFEYKVAHMIATWGKATNITLNNKFSTKRDFAKPDNEVDIIFEAGGRRFFVEVKTSIAHSTDIDKFNSVVGRMAGTGALKLFVAERVGAKGGTAISKCKQYGIAYFFLEKKKKDPETAFHGMLDNLTERINK